MHLSLIPKRSERNKINSKRNEKSVSVRVSGSGRDTAKGREGVRGVKKAGERRRSRKTNSMKENDSRERRRPPTKRTHVASYTYTHTFPSVSSTYSRSSPLSPSLPPLLVIDLLCSLMIPLCARPARRLRLSLVPLQQQLLLLVFLQRVPLDGLIAPRHRTLDLREGGREGGVNALVDAKESIASLCLWGEGEGGREGGRAR